jgi:retron-type reverse transcriptase
MVKKQKTEQDTCQRKDRAEPEGYEGGQTFLWMNEKEHTNTTEYKPMLLEYTLSPTNLNNAYKQVKRNDGSGGVDKMDTKLLLPYLQTHREELLKALQEGSYKPHPVRRVEISKENGKKRQLGSPTVVDRVIQ